MSVSSGDFWSALEILLRESRLVIDRPRGSCHPRFVHLVYPLDYGYLEGTRSMDGGGIDVWRGSNPVASLDGVLVTVDLVKKDSEIKLLVGCSEDDIAAAELFHNNSAMMKSVRLNRETS
jgi:inorganic pyrophosphatase